MEIVPVIIVLILMGLTILFFSKESVDFVAVAIISAAIAGLILQALRGWTVPQVFGTVEFEPIIFIFGMSVIAFVAERERIFQVFAIVLIKTTKGNERYLFYVICIVSTLSAAFLADVTVAIIFVPIIIRTCQILKIPAGTYLMGMTITINLGSLITPFSSGENILIASYFNLDLPFFLQNFLPLFGILMLATLGLLDLFFLKKEDKGPLENKLLLLEILNPDLVIVNKRSFYKNTIAIMVIFVLMLFISQSYIVVIIGAMVLILINKLTFKEIFKKIEWEILFFLICLMIMLGALTEFGLMEVLSDGILSVVAGNYFGAILLVLVLSSVLSAFLANTPTTLIFLPILANIIAVFPFSPIPLYLALLIGVNLGGNFIPQGAACDMMTLQLATEANVKDMNYKRLLKQGGAFAFIHLGISILYLGILSIIMS